LDGEVTGSLDAGEELTVSIDARMPGGWEGLHLVDISIRSGSEELDHVRFDIEDNQLTLGDQEIVVGTGAAAEGTYLRIGGDRVIVTTGGANLSFGVTGEVLRAIPADARFQLSVTDDFDQRAAVTRELAGPADTGLTWETALALAAAALFIGAFVGNLFASKRRPPPRPSVYATVQRKLDQDRAAAGKPDS
jgi:hypothetical protein